MRFQTCTNTQGMNYVVRLFGKTAHASAAFHLRAWPGNGGVSRGVVHLAGIASALHISRPSSWQRRGNKVGEIYPPGWHTRHSPVQIGPPASSPNRVLCDGEGGNFVRAPRYTEGEVHRQRALGPNNEWQRSTKQAGLKCKLHRWWILFVFLPLRVCGRAREFRLAAQPVRRPPAKSLSQRAHFSLKGKLCFLETSPQIAEQTPP